MKQTLSFIAALGIVVVLAGTAAGQSERADEVISRLQRRYANLKTLSANFTQIYRGHNIEDRESGLLLLKQPNRMYWEYTEPSAKIFVADGREAFFYVPAEKQVMVSELRLTTAETPLLFLFGKGDMSKDFRIAFDDTEPPLDTGNILIRLTPKQLQPDYSHVLVEITPLNFLLRRLVIVEPVGVRNDYVLSNIEENVDIPNRRFKFKIPKGVEVIPSLTTQLNQHRNSKELKLNSIRAQITGLGMYVPERVMHNHDMEQLVDTSDRWIQERTGIRTRHVIGEGQANSDLSVGACQAAMKSAGCDPKDIELIIVATVTPDMMFPSTACVVQNKLGASNAWGFDLSGACSGFLYAMTTGAQFIQTGAYKKILIVGTDVMTSILDFEDRATCVLFGDGAGAVVLEASTSNTGIIDFLLRADGHGGQFLYMPGGGSLNPTSRETVDQRMHYVHQDGKNVFKYAVKLMSEVSLELLQRNGYTAEDIKLFVPHQANLRIIKSSVERLGLKPEQVLINIDRYANTTAATIPIGLVEAVETGRIKKGDLVLLASFGAGFTWGSILLRWGG